MTKICSSKCRQNYFFYLKLRKSEEKEEVKKMTNWFAANLLNFNKQKADHK